MWIEFMLQSQLQNFSGILVQQIFKNLSKGRYENFRNANF